MGTWIKERKRPAPRKKTEHQKKVAKAGKLVGKRCKGKKGTEYRQCRHEVMKEVFEFES